MTTAAEYVARWEGYASVAYWDVNHWRLGYGSDTEGPDQIEVIQGMQTTKARALANLAIRIPQFQHVAKHAMGPEVWAGLNQNQQNAITSLVYNYGRLPIKVYPADPEKTAEGIRALQNANGGVNRKRRLGEAFTYLEPVAATQQPPPPAPVPAPMPPVIVPPWTPAPAPAPVPSAPVSIPASDAGRQAAVLGPMLELQKSYAAQIAALPIVIEKAALDAFILSFTGLVAHETAPASDPVLTLPAPTGSPNVVLQPAPKPALSSTTIWGGISAILGMVLTVAPTIIPALPPQWQTVAGGLVSGLGGLLAIYGRNNANIAQIQGIVSSK